MEEGLLENGKVQRELDFYAWTGFLLYTLNIGLYLVDFYQRYGWDIIGYSGFVAYFGINVFLLIRIREKKNWARNLFLVKLLVFFLVFYPQALLLKSGSWMYSEHFPHGVFQRISNFGNFAYELFFALYLLKRSVRFEFRHA